jgi:hypothetical protein
MTAQSIQKQIEAIKTITNDVLKSKESTRKILVDAGIMKETVKTKPNIKR